MEGSTQEYPTYMDGIGGIDVRGTPAIENPPLTGYDFEAIEAIHDEPLPAEQPLGQKEEIN